MTPRDPRDEDIDRCVTSAVVGAGGGQTPGALTDRTTVAEFFRGLTWLPVPVLEAIRAGIAEACSCKAFGPVRAEDTILALRERVQAHRELEGTSTTQLPGLAAPPVEVGSTAGRLECTSDERKTGIAAAIVAVGGADIDFTGSTRVIDFFPGCRDIPTLVIQEISESIRLHCWCTRQPEVNSQDSLDRLQDRVGYQHRHHQSGPQKQQGSPNECCT